MSTEARAREGAAARGRAIPCRSLAEYVVELVARLDAADPRAGRRMRDAAGTRRARITLDGETLDVRFAAGRLVVSAPGARAPHGTGSTDRATTLDLLAGRLEVTDAILEGRIEVTGALEDVMRIFHAIDVLLDAAARAPALQELARDYAGDPCRTAEPRPRHPVAFDPTDAPEAERILLRRLDLMP